MYYGAVLLFMVPGDPRERFLSKGRLILGCAPFAGGVLTPCDMAVEASVMDSWCYRDVSPVSQNWRSKRIVLTLIGAHVASADVFRVGMRFSAQVSLQ